MQARSLGYDCLQGYSNQLWKEENNELEEEGREQGETGIEYACGLLKIVRRAPAASFPCYPSLVDSADNPVNIDADHNCFPILEERFAFLEEYHEEMQKEEKMAALEAAGTDGPDAAVDRSYGVDATVESHKCKFQHHMQAIGEIRSQWERPGSGTDATRRKLLADKLLEICKELMSVVTDVPHACAEIVNAMHYLTAHAALTGLLNLTDRTEKDKQDDTDAIMHITEEICRTLQESTDGAFMGPSRALPSQWRDKYRHACFRVFYHGAQSYDEQSVKLVNQNSFLDAQKCNSSATRLLDAYSDFMRRMESNSVCKVTHCLNCIGDPKELEIVQKSTNKQWCDLHHRLLKHEEIISERLEKDPNHKKRMELQKKMKSKARKQGNKESEVR